MGDWVGLDAEGTKKGPDRPGKDGAGGHGACRVRRELQWLSSLKTQVYKQERQGIQRLAHSRSSGGVGGMGCNRIKQN